MPATGRSVVMLYLMVTVAAVILLAGCGGEDNAIPSSALEATIAAVDARLGRLEQLHPTPTATSTPTATPNAQAIATAQAEARAEVNKMELQNLQTSVVAMMTDNNLTALPNPVSVDTKDMTAFPDATSVAGSADKLTDPTGTDYGALDKDGYLLYQHDIIGDGAQTGLVNYVAFSTTICHYTATADGTVTQHCE